MHKESILGYAHGIDHAAGTVVFLAAMVGVSVAEDNLHAARRHTGASARTLTPVVVPAAHHLDSELIHIVVIFCSRLAAIQRAVALLVEGIAVLIPILAQALIATVFHRPHRVLVALVDIQHLAAVLRLIDVEHLTAADGTAAAGVIVIANLLHFQHVLAADALVATLVEEYRGVVAVIDDGIAHQFRALCPSRSFHILLCITGRHCLNQSYTVTRLNVLLPRCDMHPAHHIATRFHHQPVRIVAQPGRHGEAHARPFVRRALGIAVYHQTAVVQPYLTILEQSLAETGTCHD